MATLKAYLGIQQGIDNWDAIIITHGGQSATSKEWAGNCIIWESVLIEKSTAPSKFSGHANCGSRATATLLSLLHPLIYLTNDVGVTKPNGYDLYVASRSKYLVEGLKQSNPVWHSRLEKNRELWMAVYAAKRRGIVIHPKLLTEDDSEFKELLKKFKENI